MGEMPFLLSTLDRTEGRRGPTAAVGLAVAPGHGGDREVVKKRQGSAGPLLTSGGGEARRQVDGSGQRRAVTALVAALRNEEGRGGGYDEMVLVEGGSGRPYIGRRGREAGATGRWHSELSNEKGGVSDKMVLTHYLFQYRIKSYR